MAWVPKTDLTGPPGTWDDLPRESITGNVTFYGQSTVIGKFFAYRVGPIVNMQVYLYAGSIPGVGQHQLVFKMSDGSPVPDENFKIPATPGHYVDEVTTYISGPVTYADVQAARTNSWVRITAYSGGLTPFGAILVETRPDPGPANHVFLNLTWMVE